MAIAEIEGVADPSEEVIRKFYYDRNLAHRVLFKHSSITPRHIEHMVEDFHWRPTPYVLTEAFRGGGKSTTIEEGISIRAGFREFRNLVIFGSSQPRAMDRLSAVKNIMEGNEEFQEIFGELRGKTWTDDVIVLKSGLSIIALGRGQSVLGIKFKNDRPDHFVFDDVEDRDSVREEGSRNKTFKWLMADVLAAGTPDSKADVLGTNRHPDDILGKIKQDARDNNSDWTNRKYPIEYLGDAGQRVAAWPERFSLQWIDRRRTSYERQGIGQEFRMEYMCDCQAAEDKTFKADMLRVEPRVRTWQAVYSMYDPARTVNAKSAHTGYASWSYIGPKIIVWEAWGRLLMPNEIVDAIFIENEIYNAVKIGVEEDGLNEWLMQPIRQEQIKRGVMLPVQAMKAPKGKMDFIRGLQPFASARELEFAKELPELKAALLSFPTGRIDAPNALAYALKMRPGAPIYDDFGAQNIMEDISPSSGHPLWLVVNCGSGGVTAVLLQIFEGWFRIYADWVREGDPAHALADLMREVSVEAGRAVRVICPPIHFDRYNNMGLVQAGNRIPIEIRSGVDPMRGRSQIIETLQKQIRGLSALVVSSRARWTLNAFAGGYCRVLMKNGTLAEYAEEGHYRVLMEGIESFAGLMALGSDGQDERNYRTRADGTRYVSTLRDR